MKKYKVKALSVGGRGKKIFRFGDIVVAENFPDENAEKLVREGFLEPIEENDQKLPQTSDVNPNQEGSNEGGKEGSDEANDKSGSDAKTDELTIDTFTKKELCEKLLVKAVPFDPQAKKEDLFNLYKSSLTE